MARGGQRHFEVSGVMFGVGLAWAVSTERLRTPTTDPELKTLGTRFRLTRRGEQKTSARLRPLSRPVSGQASASPPRTLASVDRSS